MTERARAKFGIAEKNVHPEMAIDKETQTATVETLNDLIELVRDSIKGYTLAAANVDNNFFKRAFTEIAETREEFLREMTASVVQLSGDPETDGRLDGLLHRAWIKIKSAIASGDDEILEECIRGEETIAEAYEETLKSNRPLTPNVRTMLVRQAELISGSLARVRHLKDAAEQLS